MTSDTRREMDRYYHDVIGGEYDRVILDPRQTASDLLFSGHHKILPRDGHMLDIGCGTGQAICRFVPPARFTNVTALDHSEGMLNVARRNVRDQGISNVEFIQTDVLDWLEGKPPQRYDLITAIGFLHHLTEEQIRWVIERMAGCLADKGCILIADPLDTAGQTEPPAISRWNQASLAATASYSEEPEEPDERPIPVRLMHDAFAAAGLRIVHHSSSWEIFNHSTQPSWWERLRIRWLYHHGGPGLVNAWTLARY